MKMKKLLSAVLAVAMAASFAACGSDNSGSAGSDGGENKTEKKEEGGSSSSGDKITINMYSFTEEVPGMWDKFCETYPEFGEKYELKKTVIPTTDQQYQPALDQALQGGGKDAPDIYCAEAAFILKYTQGDAKDFAMPYKDLGIDVDAKIKEADIAQYTIDIGSRDGQVVGLGYQATGGAFIYRRSIAKEVFGSDDPADVAAAIGGGSGNLDKFWEAAETLKSKGHAIISGDGDLWHLCEKSAESGWIVDGKLNIAPMRENFLDYSKKLKDNGWHNDTEDWKDAWFADMKGEGDTPCLGFFGPAWLVNYSLKDNCGGTKEGEGTFGDWAVCESPVGFFWGGTWLLANKDIPDEKKEAVAKFIEWVTLDSSETGLQYLWANGKMNESGTKDVVASNTVMKKSDGTVAILGGQNMFDVFTKANVYATGKNDTQYDEKINGFWRDQVRAYAHGEKDRDAAIADFKANVKENINVTVE